MIFKSVPDPFGDTNIVQVWNEGNLYFRLKYLPMSRKFYLRLDKIEFGQDNVLREWDVLKGDIKSKKRAITKTLKIIAEYEKNSINNLLKI